MSEEEKLLNDLKDYLNYLKGKNLMTSFRFNIVDLLENSISLIENQQKEIERLDYELVREEQYTDVYKDLCNKQQKLINQLLEDMKERANNFSYESEIMWRKIEKAEKLLEEK